MSTMGEASRRDWTSRDTVEHINAGSLQRIAAALELSCKDREKLERDYAYMRSRRDNLQQQLDSALRSNAALRGVIKRMKRKESQP